VNAVVSIFLTLLIFLASGNFAAGGLILTVSDGKGQKTAFTYDGLGRKTRTLWDPRTAAAQVLSVYHELTHRCRDF
jgi:YD repeat-containing protein